MKEEIEVEVWYVWSVLDQQHTYSVVCRERPPRQNYWIFWLWFKMGEQLLQSFRKNEKQKFKLLPFDKSWDENSKLIASYKTVNKAVDFVIPRIISHFKKVKSKQ